MKEIYSLSNAVNDGVTLSPEQQAAPEYEEGVSCPACFTERSEAQRAGYRERHRQEKLAARRGAAHVGAVMSEES